MSKIVYILGAGFSKCTKAPLQNEILINIFNLTPDNDSEYTKLFIDGRNHLKEFLHELFQNDNGETLSKIDLENLFTILDKSVLNRENIKKYSFHDIYKLRSDLNYCIVYMFNEKLKNSIYGFYKKLADSIVARRTSMDQSDDPFSFISLNWDIILDNSVFQKTLSYNNLINNDKTKCFVDYTCYAYPYEMVDYPYRSIDVKARGHFNIKIMKLHGSLNWLICSNCGRLFFKLDEKIAIYEMPQQIDCPECKVKALRSLIVAPTLLKDLNNTHLKMIWHNALLDLMEANKVVFVGYSFPIADYELRYLLKRAIKPDAEIIVVEPNDNTEVFDRYQQFFGNQFKNSGRCKLGTAKYFSQEFKFDLQPLDCPDPSIKPTCKMNQIE